MNPNFALDFRNDQIVLLHSQEGIWVQIGIVAIDDPDLDAALGYMRSTALGLSPRGIASKLILPDAAILYTTLDALSPDAQTRATQIAVALIGRTPYEVADLVYDWTDEGAKAHLAVIARETLDEAEAFANQHRFNPVAFAAWPELGQYPTEADFGRSATAEDFAAPIPETLPIPQPLAADNAAELSASDFEMGEMAADPAQDFFADEQPDGAALDHIETDDIVAETAASEPIAPEITGENEATLIEAVPEARAEADEALFAEWTEPQDTPPLVTADFELTEGVQFDPTLTAPADAAPSDPIAPDAPPLQPDLFAPAPSFDAVMAEEAPMAFDVPSDEALVEEPPQVSGPSAGKAQTLLAEFAARREAALGKANTLGRVEPVLSAGKTAMPAAPSVSPNISAETAPKIVSGASQIPSRIKEASLGSKPAVKRPAPKARGSRSALMGFVLTILLLIALAAAAGLSSYLSSAWNSYSSATALASVQPSIADELASDSAVIPPSGAAPLTADLAVPNTPADPVTLPVPSLMSANAGSLVPLAAPAALPQPIVVAPPDITTASAEIAPVAPLITPTAQGIMTPEGVFLIAGRPSVLPLARPATVVTAALQRPVTAANDPPSGAVFADPALAGKRPLGRPEGLAPLATAPVINDPALAGKRPLTRPETVLAAGNAAQIALASLAQIAVDAPRSAMAVTISRLPAPRPNDLKTTVEAPQELALATPEVVLPEQVTPEVAAPVANAPLEADNEPEVVAPKSSGPRTVVSKNATFKNAINLSKVNLIGVYGSQANRYALIRQSNGRFKKVYVGDRFDGGMVAAITESELRYSKGGQMLALQMPKG